MKNYSHKKPEPIVYGQKPLTEFEKRMIAYTDSNHDLCVAIVRELERLNENIESLKNEKI